MERLLRETRETFTALTVVACLAAGIGGAVFYAFGPDGWLVERVRALLLDPNMATLSALMAIVAAAALAKRALDRNADNPLLNNLLVAAVGLGGFVMILQSVYTLLG